MQHKVKVTVLDTKLYPEYQQQYCANPCSGKCPVYNKGDEFVFYRDDVRDDYWHCGLDTLVKTDADPAEIAGGPGSHSAQRRGMPYRAISTPACRAAPL